MSNCSMCFRAKPIFDIFLKDFLGYTRYIPYNAYYYAYYIPIFVAQIPLNWGIPPDPAAASAASATASATAFFFTAVLATTNRGGQHDLWLT